MARSCFILLLLAVLPAWGATLYTGDGVVSNQQEAMRWLINRARYAPEREADELGLTNSSAGGHPDYDVCEDTNGVNDFGTTTNQWAAWTVSRQPLAPNAMLSAAAQNHSQDIAEQNVFSHESPSANYYPMNSTASQRAGLEGYATWFGENIGIVYVSASSFHNDLFSDGPSPNRGHRLNILNAGARDIGLGYTETGTGFLRFYVQDYGSSSGHFFTDTLYYDGNTNAIYNPGEGVGGIEIRLWNGTNEAQWYDVSQSSGSFAIPIDDLPDGSNIWVELRNVGTTTNLTIPFGYSHLGALTLTNGESFRLGSFVQPLGITNVGFRNCSFATKLLFPATVSNEFRLVFPSFARGVYRIEFSNDLKANSWQPWTTITASASTTIRNAPSPTGSRTYRVNLLKD